MSLLVGLTGGMGSGKTTVAGMFSELGVPVYNSDREARRLMEQSAAIRERITGLLGEEAYHGSIPDREFIAGIVFGAPGLLKKLNAIIHPEVRKDFKSWAKRQRAPYLIQEAAVLFENGSYQKFDRIIMVSAPREERIRRIRERDGLSRQAIEARMANQWEDSRKAPLADFIIQNLDLVHTREEVNRIHRELTQISA